MNIPDTSFAGVGTVLDVGGWFKPEPRATHVIDLLPWETRGAKLTLAPLPGERFRKDTWTQADFLAPDLRLPFADHSFDLVLCGHTIEDLVDPEPLLRELARVARRGLIECPSRLAEQTVGWRDRASTRAGHPHHHWIIDDESGVLVLYSKADSALHTARRLIPLEFTERLVRHDQDRHFSSFPWSGSFAFRIVRGAECRRRAQDFVTALKIPASVRGEDRLLRFARRIRSYSQGHFQEDFSWWPKIVAASRPYSRIDLK